MAEKIFKIKENQMKYLEQEFTRYPTLDFEQHEQTKEVCPNCSERMNHMCIPDSFRFKKLSPKKEEWKSSGIFCFSGCTNCHCHTLSLNEDEFLKYANDKLTFSDFLEVFVQDNIA